MSRSHRKHPIIGMTTSRSEKQDKRIANRRMRAGLHQARHRQFVDDPREGHDYSWLEPDKNDYGSPWTFDKDGKQRFNPNEPGMKKWMRK